MLAWLSLGLLSLTTGVQGVRAFTLYNGSPHPRWYGYAMYYYYDISFTHQGVSWQTAFDSAASEWASNAGMGWEPFPCSYAPPNTTCYPVYASDLQNPSPLAVTRVAWGAGNYINSETQQINSCSCINWYTGTGVVPVNKYDLATVAKHELGHSLGLCHSAGSTKLMYAYVSPGQRSYVGADAVNGNYYLYYSLYSGPGPEQSSCL